MNVLHISRTMGQGGAEKIVYQLCCDNKMSKNVIASTGGVYKDKLGEKGVKHYTIPDIDKKDPLLMIKTILILNKIIDDEKIDIIHSHHRMAAFYARILKLLHKQIKHIYTAHNVFYGKKKLMRFALSHSVIVACGETVRDNLINEYGIEYDRISLIYNAVDTPDYTNVEKTLDTNGRPSIGIIGRLSEQKGTDVFIKSIGFLKKKYPTVLGVIIGDGENKEQLMDLSKELYVEDNILFLGYREDVFSLIKSVDFIVLCSRWEGFPLTPIEVFSMKKSIVVSNIKNNMEIVTDNFNGKVFEKDNYIDLSQKIEEMFDEKLRKKLEEQAYQSYLSRYSYKQFIEKYKNIYLGV